MKKSISYARYGETTLCTVTYENGLSHSSIGKHPDEREAQKLAYKALQAYVERFSLDNLRTIREDLKRVEQQIREGKTFRGVRVEVNGVPIFDETP